MKTLYILLFISIYLNCFGEEFPTTKHEELPGTYHIVENLYLSPAKNRFIFHSGENLAKKVLPKACRTFYSSNSKELNHFKYYTAIKTLPKTSLIFFERNSTANFSYHFYHVLEHLLGAWQFYMHDKRLDVSQVIIASDGTKPKKHIFGQNYINYHLVKALFPEATLTTLYNLERVPADTMYHFEKAVISDRYQTDNHPLHKPTEVHLSPALDKLKPEHFESLSQALKSYLKIKPSQSEKLRVTYVLRSPPRNMETKTRQKLFQQLLSYKNIELRNIDFAKISFKEQVEIVSNTDLLIGVHGNGLSHLVSLPKDAALLEIFPDPVHTFHYRHLAEGKGIRYYAMKSNQMIDREEAFKIGLAGGILHERIDLTHQVKDLNFKALEQLIEKELKIKKLSLQ